MLAIALGLGLGLGLGLSPAAAASAPSVGTTWDYPLGFSLKTSNANASTNFYSVDLFDTAQSDIAALQAAGHFVACYFSAGSDESWRPDSGSFPPKAVGKPLSGWKGERWVDTRNAGVRSVMQGRISKAQSKGCDGVDADNIDGYENPTGFGLTKADGVDYVEFLANASQAAGLLYGLKNGGDILSQVESVSAWVINEQCAQYNECKLYEPFVAAGKPVFHVEYTAKENAKTVTPAFRKKACGADGQAGFSSIIKHMNLDNWVIAC